ncbi:hypothetical protein D3C84_674790 [compost metagenome]
MRGGALDQHHVAELQLEVVEVTLDVLVLTVHGEHGDAVARGQVEVAHGPVAETRTAPDYGLGQHHVVAADGLEGVAAVEGQVAAFAQLHHVLHLAMQYQAIAIGQLGVVGRFGQLLVLAEQFEHLQAAAAVEVGFGQGLADHR